MINEQVLIAKWHEVSGKLKAKWGTLSDDDLQMFNGNVEQLIGRIQQRTHESREVVEKFLGEVANEGASFISRVGDRVAKTTERTIEGACEGFAGAEHLVEEHPAQSVVVAFGLGFISGIGVALLLQDRPQQSRAGHARTVAEQVGRHILDALAGAIPDSLKKTHHG